MYEHKSRKLLPRTEFAKRVCRHGLLAFSVVGFALAIGVLGYHYIAGLEWVDAFLDASMILGGMGQVNPLVTPAAKIFAACYALFAGLVFIGVAGLIVLPFAHRVLHAFHLEGRGHG